MIIKYYKNSKNIVLFIISTILTLIGWGISVFTFMVSKYFPIESYNNYNVLLESFPISVIIRLIYGLSTTIYTNYYLEEEYKKKYNYRDVLKRYQYYIFFSLITIISGWILTINVLIKFGYTYSVILRLIYGFLCTFITLRFIPKVSI